MFYGISMQNQFTTRRQSSHFTVLAMIIKHIYSDNDFTIDPYKSSDNHGVKNDCDRSMTDDVSAFSQVSQYTRHIQFASVAFCSLGSSRNDEKHRCDASRKTKNESSRTTATATR